MCVNISNSYYSLHILDPISEGNIPQIKNAYIKSAISVCIFAGYKVSMSQSALTVSARLAYIHTGDSLSYVCQGGVSLDITKRY